MLRFRTGFWIVETNFFPSRDFLSFFFSSAFVTPRAEHMFFELYGEFGQIIFSFVPCELYVVHIVSHIAVFLVIEQRGSIFGKRRQKMARNGIYRGDMFQCLNKSLFIH